MKSFKDMKKSDNPRYSNEERLFYQQFGNRIREIRKLKHISQVELAKYLNCSQASVSFYETGQRVFHLHDLASLCDSLNITPNELLGYRDKNL